VEVAPDALDPTTSEPLLNWIAELPDEGVRRVVSPGWAPLPGASKAARTPG
jgi:hypothetical protein